MTTGAPSLQGGKGGSRPAGKDEAAGGGRRPIRVGLVDDHLLVREGLRLVLEMEPGIDVVGEASTSSETFDMLASARPDVLVLDVSLPGADGIAILRELSARQAAPRVVVLTMHREAETVRQALRAGAMGYVVKGARSSELVQAIQAVMRGERYLHSSVTSAIVEDSIRWMRMETPLSSREREILALVAEGRTAIEVGRSLGISPHTVRRHVANISEKLDAHGQRALTRYAIEKRLIREDR